MERSRTWGALLAAAFMVGGCGEPPVRDAVVIAQAPGIPGGIEVDGTYVYWTSTYEGGAILRTPIAGEELLPPEDLVLTLDPKGPFDLELVENELFWTNRGTGADDGAVMVGGTGSPGGTPLVQNLTGPTDLIALGDVLFLVDVDDVPGTDTGDSAEVKRLDRNTMAVTAVGGGLGTRIGGIAVGPIFLSWTQIDAAQTDPENAGTVWQWPLDDSAVAQGIAGMQDQPRGIAESSGAVIWATLGSDAGPDGAIRRVDPDSGEVADIATDQNVGGLGRILVDGDRVYWFNAGGGTEHELWSAPVTGGTATSLAIEQGTPYDLVADGTHIYWTVLDGLDGKVLSIEK